MNLGPVARCGRTAEFCMRYVYPLSLLAAFLMGASISPAAQTTVLDENFNAGVVPPPTWFEVNNGNDEGWQADSSGTMAVHLDDRGWNDNYLLTPILDLSLLGECYLHGQQGQTFTAWRDQNLIEVSLDGGMSFLDVYEEFAPDGMGQALEVDLSTYVGLPGVQVVFHYQGDYANEWYLDDLIVDDQAPPPSLPHWPHLPTSFVSGETWLEDFDSITVGSLPNYMAVNSVNPYSREDDPEGWCNAGQLGPSNLSYSGPNGLELGLIPATQNYHDVANALIIGLNGANVTDFTFSFHARQFGEELSPDDGIWISSDGIQWEILLSDWVALTGGSSQLGESKAVSCDLSSTTVDVSGDFYLAICQEDNYPFRFNDGVAVDQLALDRPFFVMENLFAGEVANLTVSGVDPSSLVVPIRSYNPGPTTTVYGLGHFGAPFEIVALLAPNAQGVASLQIPIPGIARGIRLWMQALEVQGLSARFSNPLVMTIPD